MQSDGKPGFIDPTGKLKLTLPAGTQAALDASEGMIWFLSDQEKHWGLCDNQGRVILALEYDRVNPFSEGLAAVNVGARWQFPGIQVGGKWGYVDKTGEVVIPIQFSSAGSVSNGLARVSDSAGTKFLDKSGKAVIDVGNSHATGEFCEGLAPMRIDRSHAGKGWLTRFIDRQGKTALSVDGWADEFREGMAVVTGGEAQSNGNSSYGYIDRTGKVVIHPQFGEAHPFSEGLAAVRTRKTTVYGKGDTWGYIDRTGNYQIEAIYNEAHAFRGGVARVHLGGTLEEVTDAPAFWKGGEWWLIDSRGKKLIQSHEE